MKGPKLLVIIAIVVSVLVIGVLAYLHFRVPQQEASVSVSASQAEPPMPWSGTGEVVTRIG